MASPDPAIGFHKLSTEFFSDHVQHSTFHSDASLGVRRSRVLKRWYQKRELGRGGFGTVWEEMSDAGEVRAVKVISKDTKSKLDYNRELKAMAELTKHEKLFVQFYGWFESKDHVHIAMEYISHGHLDDYLAFERSEREAKVITRQLLEGLAVMHRSGFAHRDLKPQNIFVVSTTPVWVKIGDFGLTKLARGGTNFRTTVYSEHYTAPEASGMSASSETSEYTKAVDIWSLGCITHKILTQVTPFPNFRILFLYSEGRIEFPRTIMLSKEISRQGMDVVERMLAPTPASRVTAEEALESGWLKHGQEEEWENKDSVDQTFPDEPPSLNSFRLHSAAEEGLLIIVEKLLGARTNIDAQDNLGQTPLHRAVHGEQEEVVTMLLEAGANVEAKDKTNRTALHYAASKGSEKLVTILLKYQAVPIPEAIWYGSPRRETVRRYAGAAKGVDAEDDTKQTPLHRAVNEGQAAVAAMLLEAGASVGARDKMKRTPLHYAVSKDSMTLVTILLKYGADPDAEDLWSDTPRLEAVRRDLGLEEVIERGELLRQVGDDRTEIEFPLL